VVVLLKTLMGLVMERAPVGFEAVVAVAAAICVFVIGVAVHATDACVWFLGHLELAERLGIQCGIVPVLGDRVIVGEPACIHDEHLEELLLPRVEWLCAVVVGAL
jgi:hypothetical protein